MTYANSLLDVGRYAAAAGVFEEAIKLNPTNLLARCGLLNARIYQQVTKTSGQSAEYDPVVVQKRIAFLLTQNPNDPYALVARASMRLDLEPEAAAQDLHLAIAVRPAVAEAHRLLADIYLANDDLPQALAAIQQALQQSPWDVRSLEAAALIHDARNEFDRAVELLQKANQLDPDYLSVLFEAANLYLRHGELQGAADLQAKLISRLENQAVVTLPKNAVAYQFPAGRSHVWLYSVEEKRHYAYQNMALLAFVLKQEPEPHLTSLRRMDLADRTHLKRLLRHHIDQWQAKLKKVEHWLEEIGEEILQAIEAGELEALIRQLNAKSGAGDSKAP